jgi:two-component system, OmpR family, alkaline phosphatase synthesis response regulator PhoP
MRNILIIESNGGIYQLIETHTADLNYCLISSLNNQVIADEIEKSNIHLIIIQGSHGDSRGLDFCKKIRVLDANTPILIIGEDDNEKAKLEGFENGADDFLCQPFSTKELLARMNSLLRRGDKIKKSTTEKNTEDKEALTIELNKRKVTAWGEKIDLTPKEFELLMLLSKNPGRSYSRGNLLDLLWGIDFRGFEHTVNSHINRLRAKIEPDINHPKYILTTWGIGYRFNDEVNINYTFQ